MNELNLLPDIPRIYTALAEWLACLVFIMQTKRRFSGKKLAGISLLVLIAQGVFLELTKGLSNFRWIFCMLITIIIMYGFILLCCEITVRDAAYFSTSAFVVAEFAASIEWQIDCYLFYTAELTSNLLLLLLLFSVYGAVYLIIWFIYHKYMQEDKPLDITYRELFSCVITGIAVFVMSNISFVTLKTPFSSRYSNEIFNVRTLVDLGGIAVLYAYHVQRMDLRVRQELDGVQNILHNQYIQYKQARDAMDMINYKYHDLKHHIIALRAEEDAGKRREYLDKMEEEIKNYEAQNKTGNKVLDTLLTSKNLYCLKHGITMTSVVDGTLFEFMDVMDICSIFGNALDNAIECVRQMKEKEKRLIHVTAFSQKSFLIIRFENYCETAVFFSDELPVTTKKETQFHGYGLKSLRYTVHKYGGEVDVHTEDSWFKVNILIPLNR